jgi:hypothetical protein
MNSDTSARMSPPVRVKIAGAGKYELLKAIGDELAFAQEELTYLNRLDITKKILLLHLESL